MKTVISVIALLTILIMASAVASNAFTMSQKVVVATDLVLIARAPVGNMSADDRINVMNERLAYILGYEKLAPRYITLRSAPGGEKAIFVGHSLLTTVTKADARANGTTVPILSKIWLRNARMSLPEARPFANLYLR